MARLRRDERMSDRDRPTNQKEAAAEVLEAAYMKASDNGTLPAKARQIYYAARPCMLELTGKDTIDYGYFSQTLLVEFMKENPECSDWDVVWDDRGHFEEPHGGEIVGLGTLSVRNTSTAIMASIWSHPGSRMLKLRLTVLMAALVLFCSSRRRDSALCSKG